MLARGAWALPKMSCTQERKKGQTGLNREAEFGEKPTWKRICYLWEALIWWWEKNGKYEPQYFCFYK
jgi:hypothetical protein